jgi:ABC-type branched-subunit amino acid transport system substrate-binding protein
MITRRRLLASGLLAFGWRGQAIRIALDERSPAALQEGVRFGVEEAARAVTLLGRTLQLRSSAPAVILNGGEIDARGIRFLLRADDAGRRAAVQQALGSGAGPASQLRAHEWHHTLFKYGASELNERFTRSAGRPMSSDHWLGWMAVKIIAEASLRAGTEEALAEVMARGRFDGHKGVALSFAPETRRLRQPLYVVDRATDRVVWPL